MNSVYFVSSSIKLTTAYVQTIDCIHDFCLLLFFKDMMFREHYARGSCEVTRKVQSNPIVFIWRRVNTSQWVENESYGNCGPITRHSKLDYLHKFQAINNAYRKVSAILYKFTETFATILLVWSILSDLKSYTWWCSTQICKPVATFVDIQ